MFGLHVFAIKSSKTTDYWLDGNVLHYYEWEWIYLNKYRKGKMTIEWSTLIKFILYLKNTNTSKKPNR